MILSPRRRPGSRGLLNCFVSPCWAPSFLLLRQKKGSKEKATPGSEALRATLRYSGLAGAAELAPAGLRQSSPYIRQPLRCSAPPMGTWKTDRKPQRLDSPSPACGRRARGSAGEGNIPCEALSNAVWRGVVGEDCLRPQAEFRSPRAGRVAQGTRRSRARSLGRLFFGYFLLAKQKKVSPPSRAEPCAKIST